MFFCRFAIKSTRILEMVANKKSNRIQSLFKKIIYNCTINKNIKSSNFQLSHSKIYIRKKSIHAQSSVSPARQSSPQMFSNVLAQPHNQKARTVLRTFETTRMQRQIVTSVPLEDSSLLFEPQITLREGDRNKFLVSRAHAVDITFCASDVFRTARQAYNWKERDRGAPGKQSRGNEIGIRPNVAALSASPTVNAIRTGPDLNYAACRSSGAR